MAYHDFEDDLLPDDDELSELAVPDQALEGMTVAFEQMRHEFDGPFEASLIVDNDVPEILARVAEDQSRFMRL